MGIQASEVDANKVAGLSISYYALGLEKAIEGFILL